MEIVAVHKTEVEPTEPRVSGMSVEILGWTPLNVRHVEVLNCE